MAEPVSITAVSAAASSAAATGASSGAMTASAAAGTATSAAAGTAVTSSGTTITAAPVVIAAETTLPSAAGTTSPLSPLSGASQVAQKLAETQSNLNLANGTPPGAQVIEFEPAYIKAIGPRSGLDLAELAKSAPDRATSKTPLQAGEIHPMNPLSGGPEKPISTLRGSYDRPQTIQDSPDPFSEDLQHSALFDETSNPRQRGERHHPFTQPDEAPEPEPANPNDPHERERKELMRLLPQKDELPFRERNKLEGRFIRWQMEEERRNRDETLVIGPHGMMERWRYDKVKKKAEEDERFRQQLEVLETIATGNPLSSAITLVVVQKTGDLVAAVEAGETVKGLTGGFSGKGGWPQARGGRGGNRPHRSRPVPKRTKNRDAHGRPQKETPARPAPTQPKKLTKRQRYYQKEVQRLKETLPEERRGRVTISILIVEKNGKQEVWVSTSLEKAPPEIQKSARASHVVIRGIKSDPKNRDLPKGEKLTHHHAEHDGVSVAKSNGYKVLEVYPSWKACPDCSKLRDMGITVIDPP